MTKKITLLLLIIFTFSTTIFSQEKKIVKASYYAHFFHGRTTANGEKFNMYAMTCAHKKLPFNTILKVRNLKNNKVIYVRVNDRGPYIKGRSIDLSYQAARELDMIKNGVAMVEYKIVKEVPRLQKERLKKEKFNLKKRPFFDTKEVLFTSILKKEPIFKYLKIKKDDFIKKKDKR